MSPWNDPIPLTRGWCLFELYCTATTDSKFEIAMSNEHRRFFFDDMKSSVDKEISRMLATINVVKSECFKEEDRGRFFDVVEKPVGFNGINSMVSEKLRDWVIRITLRQTSIVRDPKEELDLKFVLANLYDNQGKYDLAEPIYVEYWEKIKYLLGDNHLDTISAINNWRDFMIIKESLIWRNRCICNA